MKKRGNKLIVLILVGIIFIVSLVVFILNYSKDDSSFTLLEKKWINDNARNVIDISVYNDVSVFGKNGNGVIFDLLDDFTDKYGINFNKVSYLTSSNYTLRDAAFRVLDGNVDIGDNDILLYEDEYVLVSKNRDTIDSISDINNMKIGVFSRDMSLISNYLNGNKNVSFIQYDDASKMMEAFENGEVEYAIVASNMNMELILGEDLNILYHISDIVKKYVLTINDKSFLNIMKKSYLQYKGKKQSDAYKKNFLSEFFTDKKISEIDRTTYNSNPYVVGYVTYMPYESDEEGDFVGTISNYLNGFEDLFDVDFKYVKYDNISDLKKALSSGEVDVSFGAFNTNSLNIDTIYTSSLFKEEYVVLGHDYFVINSVKGLNGNDNVITLGNSYINDYLSSSGVKTVVYDNTDELLRHISKDKIIVVDNDTYEYYRDFKFNDYKVIYKGVLPYEYKFVIRDVNKNTNFAKMFDYYVSLVNYDTIRYSFNTNTKIIDFNVLVMFIIIIGIALLASLIVFIINKKKKKNKVIHNNDKLKYIDAMTSLKNRTYLNYKIKEWDDNRVYPQAFVVVDLNNIKSINDSHGHEEGDNVIKRAASMLIVSQEANTDIIRTDGNEFLIYMVGYDEKKVVDYTRKIYKELKNLPYGYGAAIGYSMILDDVKSVDDAINEASIDMRNKKESM